jgi:mono/diheme cytochrome c family protein
MNRLGDLLLARPAANDFLDYLLFTFFSAHLLLVLLMLGTAMIAVFFFIHGYITDQRWELRWDKQVLRIHLVLKSLAVVLGVGPLLVIQVRYSVPFLTAISILGPYWMALIVLLIFAFLTLDTLGHKAEVHLYRHLFFGVLGLAALLAVPAVFTAALSLMERPDIWRRVAASGMTSEPAWLFHWALRYLHVLGAAALFGAAFHYLFSTRGLEERRRHLLNWIVGATLFQVVVGMLLLVSIRDRIDPAVVIAVAVGLTAAMLLLAAIYLGRSDRGLTRAVVPVVLLVITLVSMLAARQFIQNQSMLPLQARLDANRARQIKMLEPFRLAAVRDFKAERRVVYDNGQTIYRRACAFCHGRTGRGDGPEAGPLIIPPEKLAQVRADRNYLYRMIRDGVPGTAMPYFRIFDRKKLVDLITWLDRKFQITGDARAPVPGPADELSAGRLYNHICSRCHGSNGRISHYGRGFRPPPPDFKRFGLTPRRAFEVITFGYPGTVMPPFGHLAPSVRWGLVKRLVRFRRPDRASP